MPGKLERTPRMPWQDLLRACLRVGGTRAFLIAAVWARRMHVLPRAYDPSRDRPGILVIALTPHLGDTVMLAPMLQALKHAHPDTPIDVAIERAAAPLLETMLEVRTVYPLRLGSTPPVSTWQTIVRICAVVREYWRDLRNCRPAVCIMPRWGDDLFRSFYLAVLTGAPRRIGFASSVGWPRYRLAPYRDLLLTEAVKGGSGLHETARFLHLLEQTQWLPQGSTHLADKRTSEALLAFAASVPFQPLASRLHLQRRRNFAVVAPGASQPRKVWPLENWCFVIRGLAELGLHTVLLSGKSDSDLARRIHQSCSGLTTLAAGTTSLAESAALLQHASVFLGSDSGPAHMAGAVGTASVVLFIASEAADADDPFSPDRNRPLGPCVQVLRPAACLPPCIATCTAADAHCIRQISPESVLLAAGALCGEGALCREEALP